MRTRRKFFILAGLAYFISGGSAGVQAQVIPGDLNLDGTVDFSDMLIAMQTWGHTGSIERLFDVHSDWGDSAIYPPGIPTLFRTLENRGDEPLVFVDFRGVAHLYWIGRDAQNVRQLFSTAVLSWGQIVEPASQLTFREPISVIPGLPPGSPRLEGVRVAARRDKSGDFHLIFPGFEGQIHMLRFNGYGMPTSKEIRMGTSISNLDAVDAVVDDEGNLHVAAMARVEFASTTRRITYQKFSRLGLALSSRVTLGTRIETGGGRSELPHPEICLAEDGNVIVLWDQGEGTGTGPGTPEDFPTRGVIVDGSNGTIMGSIPFTEAWVEPGCHWIPGVGLAIAYMQFVIGDGREIFYTVLGKDDFSPMFNPIRLSPPASVQFDGPQIAPVNGDFYVAFNREGTGEARRPQLARVTPSGQTSGPFAVDGPAGGGLFQGPVRISVGPGGSAHLAYGFEVFIGEMLDPVHYVRARID